MTIYFSLLVALIGATIYVFSNHPKLSEIGRMMFWTGFLAFLLGFAGHAVDIIGK